MAWAPFCTMKSIRFTSCGSVDPCSKLLRGGLFLPMCQLLELKHKEFEQPWALCFWLMFTELWYWPVLLHVIPQAQGVIYGLFSFGHKPISNNLCLSRGLSPKMSPTLMDNVGLKPDTTSSRTFHHSNSGLIILQIWQNLQYCRFQAFQ